MPSASWRPRRVGGVIQSKSEGLGTREAPDVNPSLGTEDEVRCPSSTGKHKGSIPPSSVHCSIQPSGLDEPCPPQWGKASTLLSLPAQMLISAGNILPDTTRNHVPSGRPKTSQGDT